MSGSQSWQLRTLSTMASNASWLHASPAAAPGAGATPFPAAPTAPAPPAPFPLDPLRKSPPPVAAGGCDALLVSGSAFGASPPLAVEVMRAAGGRMPAPSPSASAPALPPASCAGLVKQPGRANHFCPQLLGCLREFRLLCRYYPRMERLAARAAHSSIAWQPHCAKAHPQLHLC